MGIFTVFNILILSVFLLLYPQGLVSQSCGSNDCIPIQSCPAVAKNLQAIRSRVRNVLQFRDFVLSLKCEIVGNNTINICCSQMTHWNSVISEDSVTESEIASLDQHPNLSLLPGENFCGPVQWTRILLPVEQNYPWLALISYHRDQELHFDCSGSLINERYVLTAARCIKERSIAGVRIGEYDFQRCQKRSQEYYLQRDECDKIIQDFRVEQTIYHEEYQGSRRDVNDIGLIRLKSSVDFSEGYMFPICLPKTSELRQKDLTGSTIQISEWKLEDVHRRFYGYDSDKLPMMHYCGLYSGELLCNHSRTCVGDPGSPLMVDFETNSTSKYNLFQYGLRTETQWDCTTTESKGYISISNHMKWILDHLRP